MGGLYWLTFHAPLRPDIVREQRALLECWARGVEPSLVARESLPPILQARLADMLSREQWMTRGSIQQGLPVMLASLYGQTVATLNIFMHEDYIDDRDAGGRQFVRWLFGLVDPTFAGLLATMWHDEDGDVWVFRQTEGPDGPTVIELQIVRDRTPSDAAAFLLRRSARIVDE